MDGLTVKQRRFIREYMLDLNATRAYQRVYKCPRASALAHGPRMVGKGRVRAAIDKLLAEREKRYAVEAANVIQELARVAFADPREVVAWGPKGVKVKPSRTLTPDQAATVAKVTQTKCGIAIEFHGKMDAVKTLAQHLNIIKNTHEISGPGGVPLVTSMVFGDAPPRGSDPEPGRQDGGAALEPPPGAEAGDPVP